MPAFDNRGRLLVTEAETIDAAQVSGRWLRGDPVEVRA